jgi:uncharacterized membrane protein YedE/YeeE
MSSDRLSWYIAGPLLGLLIVGLRAALNRPFGGFVDLADAVTSRKRLGFRTFLLLGMIAGGAVYAVTSGTFLGTIVYGTAGGLLPTELPLQLTLVAVAGAMMGYGARTAGGCTSGHGLCGMSLLSPASIVSTMTFFATAVVLANAFALISGDAP